MMYYFIRIVCDNIFQLIKKSGYNAGMVSYSVDGLNYIWYKLLLFYETKRRIHNMYSWQTSLILSLNQYAFIYVHKQDHIYWYYYYIIRIKFICSISVVILKRSNKFNCFMMPLKLCSTIVPGMVTYIILKCGCHTLHKNIIEAAEITVSLRSFWEIEPYKTYGTLNSMLIGSGTSPSSI